MEISKIVKSNILRYRVDGTLEVTPSIKEEIAKILSSAEVIEKHFSEGGKKYFARLVFSLEEYKESDGLEFKLLVFNRPPYSDENQEKIFDQTIQFLELHKLKIKEASVSAVFKYSLENYDSLIKLPMLTPMPPLTSSDKAEIHGIRFDLTDSEVGRYSHSIDLYGTNIFHDISFTISEKSIYTSLFDELLAHGMKLSFKLVSKKVKHE